MGLASHASSPPAAAELLPRCHRGGDEGSTRSVPRAPAVTSQPEVGGVCASLGALKCQPPVLPEPLTRHVLPE
jgi:hypothetical protein